MRANRIPSPKFYVVNYRPLKLGFTQLRKLVNEILFRILLRIIYRSNSLDRLKWALHVIDRVARRVSRFTQTVKSLKTAPRPYIFTIDAERRHMTSIRRDRRLTGWPYFLAEWRESIGRRGNQNCDDLENNRGRRVLMVVPHVIAVSRPILSYARIRNGNRILDRATFRYCGRTLRVDVAWCYASNPTDDRHVSPFNTIYEFLHAVNPAANTVRCKLHNWMQHNYIESV